MFVFHFYKKNIIKTCIKTLNCMFSIATFFRHYTRKEYLTQIIKTKTYHL